MEPAGGSDADRMRRRVTGVSRGARRRRAQCRLQCVQRRLGRRPDSIPGPKSARGAGSSACGGFNACGAAKSARFPPSVAREDARMDAGQRRRQSSAG